LPRDSLGGHFWSSNGRLSVTREGGTLDTYEADGDLVGTARSPWLSAVASVDGSTVAFWDEGSHEDITVARNGESETIAPPVGDLSELGLAPDGSAVWGRTAANGSYALLLKRL
jgi:hypothetical protein